MALAAPLPGGPGTSSHPDPLGALGSRRALPRGPSPAGTMALATPGAFQQAGADA